MSLDERIDRLRAKRVLGDLFVWPRIPLLIREPSKNELESSKRQRDIFKCCHNRHYFVPCMQCKRTQSDADAWYAYYEEHTKKLRKTLGVK